jgi:hypothetical protein
MSLWQMRFVTFWDTLNSSVKMLLCPFPALLRNITPSFESQMEMKVRKVHTASKINISIISCNTLFVQLVIWICTGPNLNADHSFPHLVYRHTECNFLTNYQATYEAFFILVVLSFMPRLLCPLGFSSNSYWIGGSMIAQSIYRLATGWTIVSR